MTEWREFRMREVMSEFYDGPHATPPSADTGPVYLGIKNITEAGALDLTEVRHIAEDDFDRWTRRVTPRSGDVIFTYEATLHRYALIPDGFRGCLGRRIALIRPNVSVVLPRYLHFALLGPTWRATVTDRIISGATVDRIPIIEFPEFPITLPDLDAQRTAVAVLGSIDDLMETNQRCRHLLEEMAMTIYREWFVRFRFPGHHGVEFVDTPAGPMPKPWKFSTLASVVDVDKGLSYKGAYLTEAGACMANLKCFRPGGGFRREGTKRYSGPYKEKHAIRAGDLIVANTDLTQAGTIIGRPAFVPRKGFEDGGLISHHLFAIRPRRADLRHWLYGTFASDTFRNYARGVASGTTVLGFRPQDLLAYPVLIPDAATLERYETLANNLRALAERFAEANSALASLRDFLLPMLVAGRIDVSRLDLGGIVASVA